VEVVHLVVAVGAEVHQEEVDLVGVVVVEVVDEDDPCCPP